jgi:5-formyltetrahydrofolate cyclo-ligase
MDVNPGTTDTDQLLRQKSALRLKARAARRAIGPEQRHAAAYALAERVLGLPELAGATAVMLYGASAEEADPGVLEFALRDMGVRIAYPRVAGPYSLSVHWIDSPDVLAPGAFGLSEPDADAPAASLGDISAVVVPGIAFDVHGNRLGFGGGYYDTLLGDSESMPPAIGFAYDEQVFEDVPVSGRDRAVDVVVTPTRTIRPLTTSL